MNMCTDTNFIVCLKAVYLTLITDDVHCDTLFINIITVSTSMLSLLAGGSGWVRDDIKYHQDIVTQYII